jgi:hypothetical protein
MNKTTPPSAFQSLATSPIGLTDESENANLSAMNIFLLKYIHREGTWSLKLSLTEKTTVWPFRSDKTKDELLADLTNVALKLRCPFKADTLTLQQLDFTKLRRIGIQSLQRMNLFVLYRTRPTWFFRVKKKKEPWPFRSEKTTEELSQDLPNIALELGCDFTGRDTLTLEQVEPFTNLRII